MKQALIATDIRYNIDVQEVIDHLDSMTPSEVADVLDIYEHQWTLWGNNEKVDIVSEAIRKQKLIPEELIGLPVTMKIPETFYHAQREDSLKDAYLDDGQIADWISDETGYYIDGFTIKSEYTEEEIEEKLTRLRLSLTPEIWNTVNEIIMLENVKEITDFFQKGQEMEEEEER